MDTCPHGSQIKVSPGCAVVFVDPCVVCETLLSSLGYESRVTPEGDYAIAS